MKLSTLVVAAASALALMAPLATAASVKTSPHSLVTHKNVKKQVTTAAGASLPAIYRAPFGPTPIFTPRYIYIPAAAPDPNAPQPAMDCITDSVYCIDAADLCEYWGQC
jgi:hypothetical protein